MTISRAGKDGRPVETKMKKVWFGLCLVGVALVGCSPGPMPAPVSDATGVDKGPKFKGPPSIAGLEVKPSTDTKGFTKLVAENATRFHARQDPFALNATEKGYNAQQSEERVFSSQGFTTLVESKSEVIPQTYVEPQPYRRLSGVVIGDSIVAILEPGEGQEPILIHPGMKILNNTWTVASIDQDKAVLRREGNTLPHEVIVRLETPPPGFGGGTVNAPGGGAGGRGGFPGGPGGFPGGPGGFPGGRPGAGRPGGAGGGGD